MDLNKAFQYAVVLAWDSLLEGNPTPLIRVEYQRQPGLLLDCVTIWADKGRGYRDLVCRYWTAESAMHAGGMSFGNNYASPSLAKTVAFIMMDQDRFTPGPEIFGHGQIFIYQPSQNDRTEADVWLETFPGASLSSVESSSRMGDEGCPNPARESLVAAAQA